MIIEPGDLILGDDDGVVCVPFDETEVVYAAANAKQQGEAKTMAAIKAGTDGPLLGGACPEGSGLRRSLKSPTEHTARVDP